MFANDWRTWVLQATNGFSVYNLDSVAAPVLVKNVNWSRAPPTPTTAAAPSGSWRWRRPTSTSPQADKGLKIYKFTDPADPTQDRVQSHYARRAFSATG